MQGLKSSVAALAIGFGMAASMGPAAAADVQTIKSGTPEIENRLSVKFDNPLLPLGIIFALGAAGVLVLSDAHRRKAKIALGYTLAGGTAITILFNPELFVGKYQHASTEVIVACDHSASQEAVPGRSAMTDAVCRELTKTLGALGNVNIRVVDVTSPAGNSRTKMLSAIQDIPDYNPRHAGAAFLVTDGITEVPGSLPFPKDTPVHALISGTKKEMDRVVRLGQVPHAGKIKQEQTLRVIVEDLTSDGPQPGNPVTLTVKAEGSENQEIQVITGEETEVKVRLAHVGPNVISVETPVLEGELTPVNNRITTSIKGSRDQFNVLLLSGNVTTTARMLRDIVKLDPDSNLAHSMLLRTPDDGGKAKVSEMNLIQFPLKQITTMLPQFDMVIFDYYPNENVIPAQHLKHISDYVKNGGSVLFLAGSEMAVPRTNLLRTPLADIIPIAPTGRILEEEAPPQASTQGQRHPLTKTLPGVNAREGQAPGWGPWDHALEANVKSGIAVMQTPGGNPLLTLDKPGKGRVAILTSEGIREWRNGYKGGGPNHELLLNTMRWLTRNPAMEEEALSVKMIDQGAKLHVERRSMAESVGPAIVQTPAGEEITLPLIQIEPGLWSAELEAKDNGVYQARQDAAEGQPVLIALTHKGPVNLAELQQTISTTSILAPLVRQSGGVIQRIEGENGAPFVPKVAFAEAGAKAVPGVLHVRRNQEKEFKGSERIPLMPPELGAFLFALFAAYGWVQGGDRKRVQAVKDMIWSSLRFGRKTEDGPQGPAAG